MLTFSFVMKERYEYICIFLALFYFFENYNFSKFNKIFLNIFLIVAILNCFFTNYPYRETYSDSYKNFYKQSIFSTINDKKIVGAE